jgi:hypothetical protein
MARILQGDIPRKGLFKRRRVAVVVVPPVEELDLVGPMQVFSASNRLAGKPVYTVEIATNADDLKVPGEGGLLSFLAQRRFSELKGTFDSLLLVCGVATRNARDAALFAWLRKMACEVRRLGSVCVGALEVWRRTGEALSASASRIESALGQGRQHLHLRGHFCRYRLGSRLGRRGLRGSGGTRSSAGIGLVLAPPRRAGTVQRFVGCASFGDEVDSGTSDVDRGKRSTEIVSANACGSLRHECSQF